MPNRPSHPDGHFYSPIVDTDEVARDRLRIWPAEPRVLGIDFNDASHLTVLQEWFPRFIGGYDYPEHAPTSLPEDSFYTQNSQFSWLDARALFVFLRQWRPKRILEVGSGYSSLLMADVNRRFLDGECRITCIEPYPRPFLLGNPAIVLEQAKAQDLPTTMFESLEAGDVLFIDSSHVAKTGSDVNWLYFEVLPRLAPGVLVHVHDIFLPNDYPRDWVIDENRSWNEQYVLRALLMFSTAFEVVFGCSYAFLRFPGLVQSALALPAGHAFSGGSFWMIRR